MKDQEQIGWGWAPKGYLNTIFQRYRINNLHIEAMWGRQGGLCAGCKIEFAHPFRKELKTGVKCEVDHKHVDESKLQMLQKCEAKDVRGLLCRRCNDFLGKVEDNKDTLRNLLNYLDAHDCKI